MPLLESVDAAFDHVTPLVDNPIEHRRALTTRTKASHPGLPGGALKNDHGYPTTPQ